jgi:hypothetical protein
MNVVCKSQLNIVVDSTTITNAQDIYQNKEKISLTCLPNPAQTTVTIDFDLPTPDAVTADIFDLKGVLTKPIQSNAPMLVGKNQIPASTHDLPSGLYIVRISYKKWYGLTQFVKIE